MPVLALGKVLVRAREPELVLVWELAREPVLVPVLVPGQVREPVLGLRKQQLIR